MAEDRSKAPNAGGPYMIQDRDHMSDIAQAGGETGRSDRPQSQQGQSGGGQQGGDLHSDSGQQNGERRTRRPKLL